MGHWLAGWAADGSLGKKVLHKRRSDHTTSHKLCLAVFHYSAKRLVVTNIGWQILYTDLASLV